MEPTTYMVAGQTFELKHYGVKGMKWGVRRDQKNGGSSTSSGKKRNSESSDTDGVRRKDRIRSNSPAYNSKTGKWTREPEGGSIRKQVAVNTAKGFKEKRAAKKALKEGYKEYQTFEKDMHKLHGRSSKYTLDKNTGKYVDVKTGKTIEAYEYKGQQSYESARKARNVRVASKVGKTLETVGSLYVLDVTLTGGATTKAVAKAGKTAVKNAMDKVGDTIFDYSILDADGKVLRRYN